MARQPFVPDRKLQGHVAGLFSVGLPARWAQATRSFSRTAQRYPRLPNWNTNRASVPPWQPDDRRRGQDCTPFRAIWTPPSRLGPAFVGYAHQLGGGPFELACGSILYAEPGAIVKNDRRSRGSGIALFPTC
jgi:hypothetical protein